MGNQLSSIAPSQILSVDHYFTDLRDYEYDTRYVFSFIDCSHSFSFWNYSVLCNIAVKFSFFL